MEIFRWGRSNRIGSGLFVSPVCPEAGVQGRGDSRRGSSYEAGSDERTEPGQCTNVIRRGLSGERRALTPNGSAATFDPISSYDSSSSKQRPRTVLQTTSPHR